MERLKTFAKIICYIILQKQIKRLFARHSFVFTIFLYAESNEKGYIFFFPAHGNFPFRESVIFVRGPRFN